MFSHYLRNSSRSVYLPVGSVKFALPEMLIRDPSLNFSNPFSTCCLELGSHAKKLSTQGFTCCAFRNGVNSKVLVGLVRLGSQQLS